MDSDADVGAALFAEGVAGGEAVGAGVVLDAVERGGDEAVGGVGVEGVFDEERTRQEEANDMSEVSRQRDERVPLMREQ